MVVCLRWMAYLRGHHLKLVFPMTVRRQYIRQFILPHLALAPLHEILPSDPLFGDSTSNQAILFSHSFTDPPIISKPQYPNYTLPAADSALSEPPPSAPNLTLIFTQTSDKPLFRTACFLNSSAVSTTGTVVNSSLWLRGPQDGWRNEWLLGGLVPSTNYTAFVIQDTHKVSGPINFVTKSGMSPTNPSYSLVTNHTPPQHPSHAPLSTPSPTVPPPPMPFLSPHSQTPTSQSTILPPSPPKYPHNFSAS